MQSSTIILKNKLFNDNIFNSQNTIITCLKYAQFKYIGNLIKMLQIFWPNFCVLQSNCGCFGYYWQWWKIILLIRSECGQRFTCFCFCFFFKGRRVGLYLDARLTGYVSDRLFVYLNRLSWVCFYLSACCIHAYLYNKNCARI